MHAVQAPNERRLAAAGGPDQRGGVIGRHFEIDIVESLAFSVPGVQLLYLNSNAHKLSRSPESAAAHDVTNRGDSSDDENYKN